MGPTQRCLDDVAGARNGGTAEVHVYTLKRKAPVGRVVTMRGG